MRWLVPDQCFLLLASGEASPLNGTDWLVIWIYIAGMIGMSWWISRRQKSGKDYYLGGNKMGPLPIALSTMATQCSTNSLLGIPALVGFSAGAGLIFLQYELALPLAMIVLMAIMMPVFRRLGLISVYGYLERRFGVTTRLAVSLVFQFTRAFATGVTVYGIGLVLSFCLGISFTASVVLLGVVTILYDYLGGMTAVIYSDVLQLVLIFGTIVLTLFMGVHLTGGWAEVLGGVEEKRLMSIDIRTHGIGDGATFGFWPVLIGGFFLYLAYYGCDQTQVQRTLSSRNEDDARKALFLGGVLRFPLVLAYCLLGIVLAGYAAKDSSFISAIPTKSELGVAAVDETEFNLAMPVFVFEHFPHGIIGLVMVGLFAAAMSSLDSTLNSLSAASMQDVVKRFFPHQARGQRELWWSKGLTIFWGFVCVFFAFFVGGISDSVVESINKIGSVINGPLLAVFILGFMVRGANETGALVGLSAGILFNIFLWLALPQVSWLWWNVIGFFLTFSLGALASSLRIDPPAPEKLEGNVAPPVRELMGDQRWGKYYALLIGYALLILILLICLTALLTRFTTL